MCANFYEKKFLVYSLIQSKFDNALESQQRNVAEIVEKDTREMSRILEEVTKLRNTFNETQDIFTNLEDFITKPKVPNVFTRNILPVRILNIIKRG